MIVTPYGDLDFNDPDGLESWVAAHDQQHRTYRQLASYQGIGLQANPLATTPDTDWFGRHVLAHLALVQFVPGNQSYVTLALDVARWADESRFDDWHNTHNLIHQNLDQAFGLNSGS